MIPVSIVNEIFAQGKREAPNEACGYLAGKDGGARTAIPLTNVDRSPGHFSLDPKEQFAAVRAARGEGLSVLAVYHTHPETPARPSAEDIRLAYDPDTIYVIASLIPGKEHMKAFRIDRGIVREEELEIE